MKFHSLLLGVSLATLGWCDVAATQETSSQPATSKVVLQEVVVTAERRSTSLLKTPIAASVLTDLPSSAVIVWAMAVLAIMLHLTGRRGHAVDLEEA